MSRDRLQCLGFAGKSGASWSRPRSSPGTRRQTASARPRARKPQGRHNAGQQATAAAQRGRLDGNVRRSSRVQRAASLQPQRVRAVRVPN